MTKRFFSKHAERIRRCLASRKLPVVLACVAIVLSIQVVGTGLVFDDYSQRDILLRRAGWALKDVFVPGLGMFSFLNGDPEQTKLAMEFGILPWWTLEELRIAFLRPLTEITHGLDYHLWPDSPALMHAHSLLWFGIMIFAAAILYRKIMESMWVAGLAAFLYAVDDAHGVPVGWLANRNALIAAVFGFTTLIVHDRWRRGGWKIGIVVGPVCLLSGLFSAEAAIAIGAYLLAYELFLIRGGLRRKIVGLFPYAVVTILWWLAYHRAGFGAEGSGGYFDPGQEPFLFLRALVERIPILLLGQWFLPDAAIYGFLPKPLAVVMWLVAVLLLAALVILLLPLLKRDPIARFWALGMILAVFPICVIYPDNRLLLFVGLGAMGLLAQFLAAWFEKLTWLPTSRKWRVPARVFVFIFIVIHGIAAPLTLPYTSLSSDRMAEVLVEKPALNLPDEESIAEKTVIFVNPPLSYFTAHTSFIRAEYGLPLSAKIRILASGMTPHLEITRVDERSLEFQPEGGFIGTFVDKLFRSPAYPMRVGQRVELTDMTVEVLSLTDDQRPLRARFTFLRSLDDPSFLFLEWKDQDFVRLDLPVVGESVRLPQVTLPL